MMEWTISTKTPPLVEPISIDDAKDWLHITESSSEEEPLITLLIVAAREQAEFLTRRSLITQTKTLKLDSFPASKTYIRLLYSPVQKVNSVKYIDVDGVLQTLSSSTYEVDADATPGRIDLLPGECWPVTQAYRSRPVSIEYDAGYGADGSFVPQPIIVAMKIMICAWFDDRQVGAVPESAERILMNYRDLS